MAHTALARQYRPRSFAEVSTQSHVSETLRRAVATDRVGHAYLFCGPRGVGKTTVARVLAMALNCPDRTPEGEPCGVCDSCTRIWGGHTALDVVEIDAASNRGVDDARDLRERAMYAPSEDGRFKVYIVDEAHMLTREAWNALLKVLEEPPPRVIFVFATTEPGRIERAAAPILSRCQRFDFRRIGVEDIVVRLAEVLDRSGESAAPEEALRSIARRAQGGMRDALSLLDQVLSLTDGNVDFDSVRRVLGLVEEERYLEVMGFIADRRHADLFAFVEALEGEGYDLVEFHHGLVEILRELLRARLGPAPDAAGAMGERAARFTSGDLLRMLRLASDLDASGQLRRTSNPRILLELLLLQLSHLDRTVELREVLSALRQEPGVESGNESGVGSPGRTEGSGGPRRPSPATPAGSPVPATDSTGTPAPTPPLAAPSQGSTEPLSILTAWGRLLDERRGVPPGLSPLLRGVPVTVRGDHTLVLEVPTGPVRERLGQPGVRAGLQRALTELTGTPAELEFDGEDEAPRPGSRVTPETVLEDRLREEVKREPLLARAVKELDLEPVD